MPDCIWIGMGWDGFWQPIKYVNCPSYCSSCHKIGYDIMDSKKLNTDRKENEAPKQAPFLANTITNPNLAKTRSSWQPKQNASSKSISMVQGPQDATVENLDSCLGYKPNEPLTSMRTHSKDQQAMVSHKEISLMLGLNSVSMCYIRSSSLIGNPESPQSPKASSLRPSQHMSSGPLQ